MKNFDWIKEVPNYEEIFTTDQQAMIGLIGLDNYLKLHEYFGKTNFYFSNAPIDELKRQWAIKYKHIPYAEAARRLGVSVKTVYNWRGEAGADNLDLFEESNK